MGLKMKKKKKIKRILPIRGDDILSILPLLGVLGSLEKRESVSIIIVSWKVTFIPLRTSAAGS